MRIADKNNLSARSYRLKAIAGCCLNAHSLNGNVCANADIAIEDALRAGKYEPEDMAKYLKTMKDKPALSGKMGFNEKGDRVGDFYRIYEVEDGGKFVLQPKN